MDKVLKLRMFNSDQPKPQNYKVYKTSVPCLRTGVLGNVVFAIAKFLLEDKVLTVIA